MIDIEICDRLPAGGLDDINSSRTEDLAKAFKQLFLDNKEGRRVSKNYHFKDLLDLSSFLAMEFSLTMALHTLRYCLRDLHDYGLVKISPDPALEPLV